MRIGQSNNHKKSRPVPENSLFSITQADKKKIFSAACEGSKDAREIHSRLVTSNLARSLNLSDDYSKASRGL